MPRDTWWLLDEIRHVRTVQDLRRYFAAGPTGQTFTGRAFEAIGGGGDRLGVQNEITAEDLVAVEMLSVQVPAEAAISLLDGQLGRDVNAHLAAIPTDAELGTADGRHWLLKDHNATRAWGLLREADGIGWVTAGKLLARKRPKLIPVYDQVVKAAIEASDGQAWEWFAASLDNTEVQHELEALRQQAEVPPHVSVLRTLDVVLWMRHRKRKGG